MVYVWCILLYIVARILELGTVGTQIQVMVYIYGVSYYILHIENFGTWNCWNANLSNGFDMVYRSIYWCWNFGTWNFWNANLGNGLYIYDVSYYILLLEILELGTLGTQIQIMVFIWCILQYIDAQNFGTWNFWNANLSKGLWYVVTYNLLHIQILELGTFGTQI